MTPSLDSVRAELAPQGTLKVGLNLANFLLVSMKDPSQAPKGIAPDLAREVAREIGVSIEFFPYATPGEMADAARRDPARPRPQGFTLQLQIVAMDQIPKPTLFVPPNHRLGLANWWTGHRQ